VYSELDDFEAFFRFKTSVIQRRKNRCGWALQITGREEDC